MFPEAHRVALGLGGFDGGRRGESETEEIEHGGELEHATHGIRHIGEPDPEPGIEQDAARFEQPADALGLDAEGGRHVEDEDLVGFKSGPRFTQDEACSVVGKLGRGCEDADVWGSARERTSLSLEARHERTRLAGDIGKAPGRLLNHPVDGLDFEPADPVGRWLRGAGEQFKGAAEADDDRRREGFPVALDPNLFFRVAEGHEQDLRVRFADVRERLLTFDLAGCGDHGAGAADEPDLGGSRGEGCDGALQALFMEREDVDAVALLCGKAGEFRDESEAGDRALEQWPGALGGGGDGAAIGQDHAAFREDAVEVGIAKRVARQVLVDGRDLVDFARKDEPLDAANRLIHAEARERPTGTGCGRRKSGAGDGRVAHAVHLFQLRQGGVEAK